VRQPPLRQRIDASASTLTMPASRLDCKCLGQIATGLLGVDMSGRRPVIKGYFVVCGFDRGCGHVFGLWMWVKRRDHCQAMVCELRPYPGARLDHEPLCGLSGDKIEVQRDFSTKECRDKFPVGADPSFSVIKAYDAAFNIPVVGAAFANRISYV